MKNQFDELTKGMAQSITRREALKKLGICVAGTLLACFGLAYHAPASPTFTTIDVPGAGFTAADDINNQGQICGWYIDALGFHGFVLSNGTYTSVDFPGAEHTSVLGINANGDVVGAYNIKQVGADKDVRGYVRRNGVFTEIDFPGAAETRAIGINAAGDIVGIYSNQKQGKHHGFLLRNGVFQTIDYPGSPYTDVWKINDNGQIVGRYQTGGSDKFHLFLLTDGYFVSFPDFAEAAEMSPTPVSSHHSGMNGVGDIITSYADSTPAQENNFNQNMLDNIHGLLLSGGVYTKIDFPSARATVAFGINDSKSIVGAYQDSTGRFHGFLREP